MQVPDSFKPFLLIGALVFIVGSYFTSDSTRDASATNMGIPPALVAKPLCSRKRGSEKSDCVASVEKAIIPANLVCEPLMRDLHVCAVAASKTNDKLRCQTEEERLVGCLEKHLVPELRVQGFSEEDIALLQFTNDSAKRQGEPEDAKGGGGEGEEEEEEGGAEAREDEGQEGDGTKEDGGGTDTGANGPEVEVKGRSKEGDEINVR